jgi:hypothetical protein
VRCFFFRSIPRVINPHPIFIKKSSSNRRIFIEESITDAVDSKNIPRNMRDRTLSSWVLRNFPDSSPKEIVRAAARTESVDLEEYQRATWLWQRRPSDVSILVHFLIFGIGALIHIPLILANDLIIFAIYHAIYISLITVCVGRFLWLESQYRRWKQDYLRSLVRLENEGDSLN